MRSAFQGSQRLMLTPTARISPCRFNPSMARCQRCRPSRLPRRGTASGRCEAAPGFSGSFRCTPGCSRQGRHHREQRRGERASSDSWAGSWWRRRESCRGCADQLAKQPLAMAVPISPGSIEKVAAEVRGSLEGPPRILVIRSRPAGHPPHAVSDFTHLPARPAKRSQAHCSLSCANTLPN